MDEEEPSSKRSRAVMTDYMNYYPEEIIVLIFAYLTGMELASICRVCHLWNTLINSTESLWKKEVITASESGQVEPAVRSAAGWKREYKMRVFAARGRCSNCHCDARLFGARPGVYLCEKCDDTITPDGAMKRFFLDEKMLESVKGVKSIGVFFVIDIEYFIITTFGEKEYERKRIQLRLQEEQELLQMMKRQNIDEIYTEIVPYCNLKSVDERFRDIVAWHTKVERRKDRVIEANKVTSNKGVTFKQVRSGNSSSALREFIRTGNRKTELESKVDEIATEARKANSKHETLAKQLKARGIKEVPHDLPFYHRQRRYGFDILDFKTYITEKNSELPDPEDLDCYAACMRREAILAEAAKLVGLKKPVFTKSSVGFARKAWHYICGLETLDKALEEMWNDIGLEDEEILCPVLNAKLKQLSPSTKASIISELLTDPSFHPGYYDSVITALGKVVPLDKIFDKIGVHKLKEETSPNVEDAAQH